MFVFPWASQTTNSAPSVCVNIPFGGEGFRHDINYAVILSLYVPAAFFSVAVSVTRTTVAEGTVAWPGEIERLDWLVLYAFVTILIPSNECCLDFACVIVFQAMSSPDNSVAKLQHVWNCFHLYYLYNERSNVICDSRINVSTDSADIELEAYLFRWFKRFGTLQIFPNAFNLSTEGSFLVVAHADGTIGANGCTSGIWNDGPLYARIFYRSRWLS